MSVFNVADALARLMNNKKLYQKLLDKFVAGYSDYDAKVKQVIDSHDMAEGVQLAHTMKGLAGNLGATSLQDVSKELEMLFRAGDAGADFETPFAKFSEELRKALDEIKAGVDMG